MTGLVIVPCNVMYDEIHRTVIIKQMGGKIGEFEDIISGSPILSPDEELVFFLVRHEDNWVIHSIALGAYRIFTDQDGKRKTYNEFNLNKIIDPDTPEIIPIEGSENIYDLDLFLSQVRSYISQ